LRIFFSMYFVGFFTFFLSTVATANTIKLIRVT
jgi:hypothetical protein